MWRSQTGVVFELSPLFGERRTTTGGLSASSCPRQFIARHSDRSSQRMHSFIFLRLAMTVPKQSLLIRGISG